MDTISKKGRTFEKIPSIKVILFISLVIIKVSYTMNPMKKSDRIMAVFCQEMCRLF